MTGRDRTGDSWPPSETTANAIATVFQAEREPLTRFVVRLAHRYRLPDPAHDAEDIVQASFAAAIENWPTLQRPGAWLYVVAHRLTAKAESMQARVGLAVDDPALEQTAASGWTSSAAAPSFEDVIAAREAVAEIGRLRGRQQIVTYLRHVHGWESDEIAELLGCARGTINVHAHRGLATVAKALGSGLAAAAIWAIGVIVGAIVHEPARKRACAGDHRPGPRRPVRPFVHRTLHPDVYSRSLTGPGY